MTRLTPRFSSDGMVREYTEKAYLPAMHEHHRRAAAGASLARTLESWQAATLHAWKDVQFGKVSVHHAHGGWHFEVQLRLGLRQLSMPRY